MKLLSRVLLLLSRGFSDGTLHPSPQPGHPQCESSVNGLLPSAPATFSPSMDVAQFQHLALKFLEDFCLCEIVNGVLFGIGALMSKLKRHVNSELPWVDEFTVQVNLFCCKSHMQFRKNSVHCERSKNTSIVKSIKKRGCSP